MDTVTGGWLTIPLRLNKKKTRLITGIGLKHNTETFLSRSRCHLRNILSDLTCTQLALLSDTSPLFFSA